MDQAALKLLTDSARRVLSQLKAALAEGDWTTPALEGRVRSFAEANGLNLGDVAQPLRAALTGRATSLPIFDILTVLGREESLARIQDQAK